MATREFIGTGLPPTAQLKKDQRRAMASGRAMTQERNGNDGIVLETQDGGPQANYVIYVYNICELPHIVNQPPSFPFFKIEPCPRHEKFSVTTLPAFVKERYERPGETEYYYKQVDGRKYATSLLNPDTFPGTDFAGQLVEGRTGNDDMTGMNLNKFGCFWSLTKPDDPKLEKEIAAFRKIADKTMDELVKEGNRLHAEGALGKISPLMHFAMEYFALEAPWHMSHRHKTPCPNCGESILEGLAYHYNSHGDRCVIDMERYQKSVIPTKRAKTSEPDADDDTQEEIEQPKPAARPARKARA